MQLRIPDGDFEGMIFDLDGTLIDSMPLHFLAWDRTMRLFGLRHQLDEDYFYDLGGFNLDEMDEDGFIAMLSKLDKNGK